ncbi:MAG TPA: hypothetical protein VMU50_15875 [Polyangia bacterium]|nr:hypothetical protein [Polyangia bacterium]
MSRTMARRPAVLPALALAVAVAGCRFEAPGLRWMETHGRWNFKDLAAWPGGALGIGMDDRVFHYPGSWGAPWNPPLPMPARAVAASPRAIWVVGTDGVLKRLDGGRNDAVRPYPQSAAWSIQALTVSEDDRPYVLVAGRWKELRENGELDDTACADATAGAATTGRLYVVGTDGHLRAALPDGRCEAVDTGGRAVTAVTAYRAELAFVDDGGHGFWRRDETWRALPVPVVYREDRFPRRTTIRKLATSQLALWAIDNEGQVFVLWEDP